MNPNWDNLDTSFNCHLLAERSTIFYLNLKY